MPSFFKGGHNNLNSDAKGRSPRVIVRLDRTCTNITCPGAFGISDTYRQHSIPIYLPITHFVDKTCPSLSAKSKVAQLSCKADDAK